MTWFYFAFISALLSAAASLTEKKTLFKLEALDFSFYLSVISFLMSIPFFTGISLSSISSEPILILYVKSVLGTLAFLFVMLVLKNFEISKALPLMVLTPGLVAIFAFIFLGDSLTFTESAGIILLMTGTYILEFPEKNSFAVKFKSQHYFYVFIALALFTTSSLLDRLLLTDYQFPPKYFMALQQLFLAFNFSILFFIRRKKSPVKSLIKNKDTWLWILLTGLFTVGYRYTQIEATSLAPVALVLSVKRISVFFGSVAGGKIFREKNLFIRAIATIIMITGTLFLLNY